MSACIVLEPPPPPAPPPPPPPAPAPTPAPAPSGPATPVGMPQVVVDLASSYIIADVPCLDNAITLPQVFMQNGKIAGQNATLHLVVQNRSGTAPGTINVTVTADNGYLLITPATASITVPAGNFVVTGFSMLATGGVTGRFVVTIDTGGPKTTFNLSLTGATDCGGGGA